MPFVHGAFDDKIDAGNTGNDGEYDGSIDPVLNHAGSFMPAFIVCSFF